MHHLQPGWRAQSASRHGQLPADISDAIPRREVQRLPPTPPTLRLSLPRPNAGVVRSCPQTKLYRDPILLLLHR